MHRIDTKTAQKDKFGAGKNGFTRGNPQTGTPATDLDDDYFDMLQEELCSVVEASGASLEKVRHDQLLTALRALLLSRKNPFGDIKSDGTVKTALENLGLGDGSGRLIQCQVFKSSGTYTPTKGTRFIIVEIVGGGGAGGGCQVGYPNNAACGGGGMSGEYVKARVDNPTVTTVTIGYGGTGASASVGAPGGATSFGNTIIAKGGLGGNVLAEGTAPGVVGPYGAYTEPGFTGANIIGSGSGYSSPGVRYSGSLAMGGPGGDSILGAGAGSQAIVGEGINANGHGGGGGGACVYGGATQQRAGGSGMAGIAIIWEYA
ncbi:carbohydrate kinase [Escherichia coli]|nr:carbohydrate kinase [Escherichia coli]MBA8730080.1 carbohydrate kinase [Escherichia coli]MCX3559999.1 carbohydrate kinase [Escherichia coli]MCX3770511.1 carbohydrate kinase [Escherichia coli]MCX3874513.1 carbohydrate kinase [Escherichia coli]